MALTKHVMLRCDVQYWLLCCLLLRLQIPGGEGGHAMGIVQQGLRVCDGGCEGWYRKYTKGYMSV